MSRFNQPNINQTKTVNLAGGEALEQSPRLALVSLLLTSMLKDQFYRSADQSLTDLRSLIDQIPDKKFVAKAAVYARTKFGMRSISHVVAGEIATRVKGEKWTKNFFDKVINRPDDMTEILAYYYSLGNKNEPNALKKGFAQALTRFDAYQLAKYKKDGQAVSLIDVANLVHPKNTEAISQLIKGTLKTPDTFETKLSKAGKAEDVDAAKTEAWKELLETKRIGYFALLRNLRNIIEQAPELVPQALGLLTNGDMIKKSLVLPFRFLTAIEEIQKLNGQGVREILGGLNIALDLATSNVPKFEGNTLVALDMSGSMQGEQQRIGALFSAIMLKSNNADFLLFDNDAQMYTYNPVDSTLTIAQMIIKACRGGGTNYNAIFETAPRAYDRIIILSDSQAWVGYHTPHASFATYKQRTGANPRIYTIDLSGYGTMQFPENNVYAIAGFSEKIFDVMKLMEQDRNALISEIEKIEL